MNINTAAISTVLISARDSEVLKREVERAACGLCVYDALSYATLIGDVAVRVESCAAVERCRGRKGFYREIKILGKCGEVCHAVFARYRALRQCSVNVDRVFARAVVYGDDFVDCLLDCGERREETSRMFIVRHGISVLIVRRVRVVIATRAAHVHCFRDAAHDIFHLTGFFAIPPSVGAKSIDDVYVFGKNVDDFHALLHGESHWIHAGGNSVSILRESEIKRITHHGKTRIVDFKRTSFGHFYFQTDSAGLAGRKRDCFAYFNCVANYRKPRFVSGKQRSFP